MKRIVFVTQSKYLSNPNDNWYTQQILDDDHAIISRLPDSIECQRHSWTDDQIDWSIFDLVVIRTTWDYFYKIDLFRDWIKRVNEVSTLVNSYETLLWNLDKKYLFDLQEKGIHTVKSFLLEKGKIVDLKAFVHNVGLKEFVLKPTIGGAAKNTFKLKIEELQDFQTDFESLIGVEDYLIQPFLHNILKGEISLVFIGGVYSHAVLKKAKSGDFRVQDDFGGTLHEYTASAEEVEFAENVLKCCPGDLTYARVDLVLDNDNLIALSEVELIEPELWFRRSEKASASFADELAKILS
ncbi:MAG: hypothetical protein MRY83_06895 [Flavobacteriales bacterium]|nr:hypothetical protein [Flavobacteriales bacterium]